MHLPRYGWCERRSLILAGFFLVAAFIGWRSPNYVMRETPAWDSGGFITTAVHMRHGRVLYKDVFDHKPPMIFFLLSFLACDDDIAGTVNAVRYFEKAAAALMTVLMFATIMSFVRRPILALAGAALFAFTHYHPSFFNSGNLTEEYGNIFLLLAIFFCSPPPLRRRGRLSLFLVGFFSCCAGLTKEPFTFSCLPWMAYAILMSRTWGIRLRHGVPFLVAGSLAALVPFTIYFAYNGALYDWYYNYVFNVQYAAMRGDLNGVSLWERFKSANMILTGCTYGLWVVLLPQLPALRNREYVRRQYYFPWIALAGFVASLFAAIGLTKVVLINYWLMLVVGWCLFFAAAVNCCLSFWETWSARVWTYVRPRARPIIVAAVAFLAFGVLVFPYQFMLGVIQVENFARDRCGFIYRGMRNVATPAVLWVRPRTTLDELLDPAIIERDGFLILNQRTALYYPLHRQLVLTKPFFGISTGLAMVRPEYLGQCRDLLMNNPPAVFIGNWAGPYAFVRQAVQPSLDARYTEIGALPLFAGESEGDDLDYKQPMNWYVRNDLVPLIADRYLPAGAHPSDG